MDVDGHCSAHIPWHGRSGDAGWFGEMESVSSKQQNGECSEPMTSSFLLFLFSTSYSLASSPERRSCVPRTFMTRSNIASQHLICP